MNTITSLLDRLAQAERERDRARQQCLDSTRMVLEMKVAAEAKCDALRGLLREAQDMMDWIGGSPEGEREMCRMRDEFVRRIDAALAGDGK
jgi:hypothetical protein